MSEMTSSQGVASSAGAVLRQAREAAGLPLETLSATIKVAQRKLESLEADRYSELPDAAFTRALAQTVCRALKIDAAPVLALLPAAKEAQGLEHVTQGLNQPFDEHGKALGRMLGGGWGQLLRPAVLAPACLVLGAAAIYFWPHHLQIDFTKTSAEAPAPASTQVLTARVADMAASDPISALPGATADQDAVSSVPPHASEPPDVSPNAGEFPQSASASVTTAAAPASAAVAVATSARVASSVAAVSTKPQAASAVKGAASATSPAASTSAPAVGDGVVALKAREDSWVDIRDAKGRVVLSRLVRAGEALSLSGVAPLQVKIGNARGTDLQFRGRAVDLSGAAARDNVARMELK